MADREKVINALEDYEPYAREFDSLSVYGWVVLDALALLKEQEPMPVLSQRECETLPNHYERKGFCPNCHQVVEWFLNRSYCGFCGRAVKWDA